MGINKYNCEAVFLDYYEQNLSPVEVAEMLFFLEENPDSKELFESYEYISLGHEKIKFPDKKELKNKYSKSEIDAILSSEVNKTNYELFFVAASEGLLKKEQLKKLSFFIARAPELRKDFELFQKCRLSGEKNVFEDKELLKKQAVPQNETGITAQNREGYFIRAIENELNVDEQKELVVFLQKNPGYKNEFEIVKQVILVPEQIVFQEKASLKRKKRKPVFIPLFNQRAFSYSAAAAILFLVGIFLFYNNNENTPIYVANQISSISSNSSNINSGKESTTVAEKKEQTPLQKGEQEQMDMQHIAHNVAEHNNVLASSFIMQEEKTMQVVSKDTAAVLTAIINEDSVQKAEVIIAENNTIEKADSTNSLNSQSQVIASVVITQKQEDKYETIGSVVNKKLRSILGIKNTANCETSEKIGLWELAMAAKNGIQRVTGTKAMEVKKVCDGEGDKVEYIFAAGKFEISKSTSK